MGSVTYRYAAAQTPRLIIDSKGHTGLVNKLIFMDMGRKLISVANDKTIRLWNVSSGILLKTLYVNQFEGYSGRIYAAAITPDEKTLAVAGFFGKNDTDSLGIGSIMLLSLERPEELKILKGHTNVVTDLIITSDGRLVSASADKTIKIWSLKESQPKLLSTFAKHKASVSRISYSPKANRLASADTKGNVLIWSLETGSIITDKIGKFHEGGITSLTFSGQDNFLFTGGADGKLIRWTSAGQFMETHDTGNSPINAMLPLSENNELLYLSSLGTILDISTGNTRLEFKGHNNSVSAVAIAPFTKFGDKAGRYVATAGGDEKEILIWNTEDGTIVRKLAGQGHGIFRVGAMANSIAYGQSNPTSILEDAPLEKIFNLSDFTSKVITKQDKVKQEDREYGGSKIYKESAQQLNYGVGSLVIDPVRDGEIRSYTFLNDHNTIAIGATFAIPIFSRTGEMNARLIGHNGEVWSVAPFSDDLLLSSSSDQTIRIWNYKTRELLLTYFPANDREWVIWSPSGFYHASAGGEKYIGWLVNKKENQLAEFHEVSEFREKFHQANFIKAILQEKSLKAAAEKLKVKLPSEEEIVKLLPPTITWIEPSTFVQTTTNLQFTVKAHIESNNPIKNVKLLVNGRPLAKLEDMTVEKIGTSIKLSYTLDLSKISFQSRGLEVVAASEVENGKKEITVQLFAENEVSTILTEPRIINYQSQEKRVTPSPTVTTSTQAVASNVELPNLYLVSIGISNFKNTTYNLNYADDDAEAIATVFKDQKDKLFNMVYNFSLLNENATRAKILTTFDKVKKIATPKDVVVVFIATHGINHENQFYIVPHDGDGTNPKISCVDWRDFSDLIGNLPSQVLLLVDACHSGQLGTNMGQARSDNTEAVREIASSEYGVVIMAAATGSEFSLEHADWAHGAFTLALIEGLEKRKADIRVDGTIYLRELDFYVSERVKELTNDAQHPTTQKPSTISAMPIVKYN